MSEVKFDEYGFKAGDDLMLDDIHRVKYVMAHTRQFAVVKLDEGRDFSSVVQYKRLTRIPTKVKKDG